MAKPVYSLTQIIDQIDSGASWSGNTITFATPDSAPDSSSEGLGFVAMTDHMKTMAAAAFQLWDDLIAPSITKVTSGADINFAYSSNTGDSTYTSSTYGGSSGGRIQMMGSDVWLASTWTSHNTDDAVQWTTYGFMTYLHEIGHALGLDHPGNYNGNATYATDAVYAQDTHRYTLMSYFDGDADGSATKWYSKDGVWHYPATPMLDDVATIQSIYGADTTTRTGNTVYGFHSNAGRDVFDFSKNTSPVVTIWDAKGKDTIDLSGFSGKETLDLHAGMYSSVGGLTNNLAIAFGAVIENGIGGSGNDTIEGNAYANKLTGGAGADHLYGRIGNDTLVGGAGNDILDGGKGTDTVVYVHDQSQYKITHSGDTTFVKDLTGGGTDTLLNDERIAFHDHTVLL